MPVRIRTSDGSAYEVDGSFDDMQKKVVAALEAKKPFIEVMNGNNELRSINPRLITAVEELPEEPLSQEQAEVLESARDRQPQPS